jgi:hypothetical protein
MVSCGMPRWLGGSGERGVVRAMVVAVGGIPAERCNGLPVQRRSRREVMPGRRVPDKVPPGRRVSHEVAVGRQRAGPSSAIRPGRRSAWDLVVEAEARFAERLAALQPGLRYANLAVRGRILQQVADEQLPQALAMRPGLVSIAAGGNDMLRPGADPDVSFDAVIQALEDADLPVLMFTGFDPRFPVLRLIRGKVAAFNMHLRAIADPTTATWWIARPPGVERRPTAPHRGRARVGGPAGVRGHGRAGARGLAGAVSCPGRAR